MTAGTTDARAGGALGQTAVAPEVARRALLVLLVSVTVNLIGTTAYSPMLSIYARDLGATGLWIGLLYGGFYGVRLVLGQPIGAFSDRVGQRRVLLISTAIYPLLAILYAISPNIQALVGTRLLHGVASAMMLPMAMAYVGLLAKEGSAGRYASYFNFANFLGMAIGPLVGGLIVAYVAFKGPFYLLFLLTVLNLPLIFWLLPDLGHSEAAAPRPAGGRRIQLDRVTAGLLAYNAVVNANTILFVSFLPLLARAIGLSILQGGLLISAIYLITSASQIPFGRLSDAVSPLLLVVAGGAVAGACLLALAQLDAFAPSMTVVCILALGGSAATAGLSAIAVEAGRRRSMGRFMGGFHSAASFGMIAISLGAGLIFDSIGIKAVFVAAGLVTLALLAPVTLLLRGTPEVAR
ncbi:MAG TPA: MFS transporter [Thermomicrobiales bacterium]|nr:MFS transporter [Thermomicrobiales bacterium]